MNDLPVWEDGTWAEFLPLAGDVPADVCVVGLGGSGLACVLELLAQGKRVVGIDAGLIGGGAAGRNGGFLLAGLPDFYHDAVGLFGRERARALYLRTLAELDRMTEETPDLIERAGSLRVADDASEMTDCQRQYAAMQADALPVEHYVGPDGHGLLIPTDGAFQPLERCRLLSRRAQAAGALLFEHSRAIDISGTLVRTATGAVRCRHVVVAVDGRLERVLPELSERVRTARLQMLSTAPTTEIDLPRPVYARWSYDYWQQLDDGRIVLGGRRDQGGEAEWSDEPMPTADIQDRLERMVRERLHVTAPITHRWAGVVGYATEGLPIVEEVRPAVWAIGGYNGTGNILGALCGRGVAQLVSRGNSELLTGLWNG